MRVAHHGRYICSGSLEARSSRTCAVHVQFIDKLADIRGGGAQACTGPKGFLSPCRLATYDSKRNDPTQDALSKLSPYLHFGQLAPARAALEASKFKSKHRVRLPTPFPFPAQPPPTSLSRPL